jgi:hypothetical protein
VSAWEPTLAEVIAGALLSRAPTRCPLCHETWMRNADAWAASEPCHACARSLVHLGHSPAALGEPTHAPADAPAPAGGSSP